LCYHAVSEAWADELAIPPDVLLGRSESFFGEALRCDADDALAGHRIFHVTFDDAY
jgi:hypothetical protein